jgi:hypothetical protein
LAVRSTYKDGGINKWVTRLGVWLPFYAKFALPT